VEDIVKLAERLGKAIADSPQSAALQAAQAEVSKDDQTSELLKEFRQHSEKVALLEHENKPVEVDDKHKLEELHNKLVASDSFKKLTAAQVEYVDMMRRVNEAVSRNLGPAEQDQAGQPQAEA